MSRHGYPYPPPTITYSMPNRPPLEVEIAITHQDPVESWELYVLLKTARRTYLLLKEVMPLLEAIHLISPNQAVEALKELTSRLPERAIHARDTFMRTAQARRAYAEKAEEAAIRTLLDASMNPPWKGLI